MSESSSPATPSRGRPSTPAITFSALAIVLFTIWTVLVATGVLDGMDRATLAPVPVFEARSVQIAAAISIVFSPPILLLVLLCLAWWASRRRLHNLTVSLILAAIPGTAINWLMKLLIADPRPPQRLPLLTVFGPSYPAEHLSSVAMVALMVGATVVVSRQDRIVVWTWQVIGLLAVLLLGLCSWWLRSNWLADLIGGVLLGVAVAAVSLMVARVRVLPREGLIAMAMSRQTPVTAVDGAPEARCAIIYNPSKIVDEAAFRRHVDYELSRHQFVRTLWLPTTVDEPGRGLAEVAISKSVGLVLVAGGDGTVRSVCDGMAGSGIPLGIVPAGTGNLLARNLGIPRDERAAIDVAFDGQTRKIDLVKLRVDDQPETQHFAVMGGMGFDAAVFEQTNADLKKAVGSAAYFVAGAQAAGFEPFAASVQIDDHPPVSRRLSVAVIGNVGFLQAGIELFPDARPDDGVLDVILASPRTLRDWARILTTVLAVRGTDEHLVRRRGKRISITAEEPVAYQLDGDTIGHARRLVASVDAQALTLRVPDQSYERHNPLGNLRRSAPEQS
ncbi:bifunctional phosphatase PAP2/diacylglycerol kinase family protein [Naumannella halotolerans]|uniref:YegS/Rv2252/BmrU family lipid kinase n=1 Tax=Naumannella halotolerans TaxID=993414 RepID=A0A4R7IYT5_9ACTN|nr:diacylglycerol kinase family protein [Naumannella halotolerans]TDT29103.1 YegS/Rv2252/BmrU family lipid kinase [Naumannella halotolerans]